MRAQVKAARAVLQKRFGPDSNTLNSRMSTRQLPRYCVLDEEGNGLLKTAMDELGLSGAEEREPAQPLQTVSAASTLNVG